MVHHQTVEKNGLTVYSRLSWNMSRELRDSGWKLQQLPLQASACSRYLR